MLIKYQNKKIIFNLNVDKNKKVSITYFGNKKNNFLKKTTPSSIVELESREQNHNGNHCEKFCMTPYAENAIYVKHSFIKKVKNDELILVTNDGFFQVESHFIFYKDVAGLSSYNVVKNISNKKLTLEYISSFYLSGFGNEINPIHQNLNLFYANTGWYKENQFLRRTFLESNLFNGNNNLTMSSFKLNNTGSWSTKDFLPILGIEDKNKNLCLYGQIENNGSWHIEIGDNKNAFYLTFSGPEFVDNSWYKTLDKNEIFVSAKASITLTEDFETSIQEMTKIRRNLVRNCKDNNELPVIYNDYMHALWDLQDEKHILPLIKPAKDAGAELFCIDAGYFHKGVGWTNKIGYWKEEPSNFPHGGLKGLLKLIKNENMKVGLWVEIENMGIECPILKTIPKEYFMQIDGIPIIRNKRYCLNFNNKNAYNWAMEQVSYLIKEYNLDYLKIDYNISNGVGCNNDVSSLGDGQLLNNRAFIRWLNELTSRFPDLTLENCSSGGMRQDYAILSQVALQSTSDQVDYRYNPYILSGALASMIPEQIGMWAYPVDSRNKIVTDEQVIYNLVTPQLGRIQLSSYLSKLNDKQFNLVKEGVEFYKKNRMFRKGALPIFPNGLSYWGDSNIAVGLIKDKKILLSIFNTSPEKQNIKVNLNKYEIKTIKVGYPKKEKTDFIFNKKTKTFTLKCNEGYIARLFEIEIK